MPHKTHASTATWLKETFITEVEVLRAQMVEQDITIEGEFLSDQQMQDEGMSERLASTAKS